MLYKKLFVYTGLLLVLLIAISYGRLAKEKAMGGGSSSDFSYDSRYAHRNDGTVNLLTGRASCHINLTSISSKSGLTYNVNLDYFGVGPKEIYNNNEVSPTGIAGLGWNLSFSSIFVEFNGSLDPAKHEYFLKDEDGSVSEIKREGSSPSTYIYRIKNHPYWKLITEIELIGDENWTFRERIVGWKLVKPDGTIIKYGIEETAQRYLPRGQSGFDPMGSQKIFYQWDVTTIEDAKGGKLQFSYKQTLGISATTDNVTVQSEYTTGKLSKLPSGGCPTCEDKGPEAYSKYIVTCHLSDWFAIRYRCKCVWPVHNVTKWYYTNNSYPSTITSDRGDVIVFKWTLKANNEVGNFLSEDPKCIDEIEYRLPGQTDGEGIQNIKFTYSGYANEVPPVNAKELYIKRLLTGITSTKGTGVFNRKFEYGQNGIGYALLTKIIEPMTGKNTVFKYVSHLITNQSSGKSYNVDVVKQISFLDGVRSNPGIVLSYSYTDDASKQDFDESSGIPYWGVVTESNSETGSVVTEFDLNKNTQKFGEKTSVKKYGTTGNLVLTENYNYEFESFGELSDQWYFPILTKTIKTKNGAVTTSGTSLCAIDPNNGFSNLSWIKNSDGKYLVTQRKYAYEVHPIEMGTSGTNQLSLVASTKQYMLTSYDPSAASGACDLSTGIVIKATYTTYAKNSAGYWFPSTTYAWRSPLNGNGIPNKTFIDFNESNPLTNDWFLTETIDKYDDFGNVLQSSNASGVSISTIYGTPNYLPVARITNAKYEECFFTSFEEDQDWNFNVGGSMSLPRSTDQKKNGMNSAVLDNSNSTKLYAESSWRTLDHELFTAKNYTFSGWIYTTGPQAEIYFFTSIDGQLYYKNLVTPEDAANKWIFLQGTFEAPAGAKSFMIRIDNNGVVGSNTKVYFDDLKFYPSNALMTTTYYDPKWQTPVLSIDANENPSQLLTLDNYGRPDHTYKINKNLSTSDIAVHTLISKQEYHLMGQALRLLNPVGGERFFPGQKYSIKWSGPVTVGEHGVDIMYSTDNGTTWNTVTDPTTGVNATEIKDQNTYLWIVPTIESTICKIRVQNHDNITEYDESSNVFTISDYLRITSPVADEIWYSGKTDALPWSATLHSIRWNTVGGTDVNVRIEFWDGNVWKQIVASTPNDGSYDWKTVEGESNDALCKIRISDVGGNVCRESDFFFLFTNYGYVRRFGL